MEFVAHSIELKRIKTLNDFYNKIIIKIIL